MKRVIAAVALLGLFTLPACKGIDPSAIAEPIRTVADRHDKLVTGEIRAEDLSEQEKSIYLRTTELLRKLLDEVLGAPEPEPQP